MTPTEILGQRPQPTERVKKPRAVQKALEETRLAREKSKQMPWKDRLAEKVAETDKELDMQMRIEGYEGPVIKGPRPSTGHRRQEDAPHTAVLTEEPPVRRTRSRARGRGLSAQDMRQAPEQRNSELNRLVDVVRASFNAAVPALMREGAVQKRERTRTKFSIGEQIVALHQLQEALFDFFHYMDQHKEVSVSEDAKGSIQHAFDFYHKWVVVEGLGRFSEDRGDPDKFYPKDLQQRVSKL